MAAAHAIHNGFNALEQAHGYFHGEKVAVGVLASLFLTDKPRDTIDEVHDFCEEVGLPTTLSGIGLAGVTDDDLMSVAERATARGRRFTMSPFALPLRRCLEFRGHHT